MFRQKGNALFFAEFLLFESLFLLVLSTDHLDHLGDIFPSKCMLKVSPFCVTCFDHGKSVFAKYKY